MIRVAEVQADLQRGETSTRSLTADLHALPIQEHPDLFARAHGRRFLSSGSASSFEVTHQGDEDALRKYIRVHKGEL